MTNPYDSEDQLLQFDAWNQVTQNGERLINDLSSFIDFLRDLMDELYKDLEEEYDSLTDDEAVASWVLESLDENELRGEGTEEEETEQV